MCLDCRAGVPQSAPHSPAPHSPGQQDLWVYYFSFQLSAQVSLQKKKKEVSAQEVRTLGTGTTDTHPALLPLQS